MSRRLVVASTFSGIGGSCTGYRLAGLEVAFANEFNATASRGHHENFPGCVLETRSIRELGARDVLKPLGLDVGELDVFDGSPPCQPFSMIPKQRAKREDAWGGKDPEADRKDDLGMEFARLLRELRPRTFVMENVRGLTAGRARGYWVQLAQAFRDAGYRVGARILPAEWLGVPHLRKRLIVIGVRTDLPGAPSWPEPWRHRVAVRDVCPEIEELWGRGRTAAGGFGPCAFPLDVPAPTLVATGMGVGFASQCRVVIGGRSQPVPIDVVRRLCSFPDGYHNPGTYAEQWRGYGNAVPPLLMRAVAERVREYLEGVGV